MKQVVFIKKERGYNPLQAIAEECKRKGHLLAIVRDPYLQGVRKYYSLGEDKRPMEITEVDNRVISARRVPEVVLKTLPPLNPPQFGNF